MATVYVKWYGKVLEGELLDGDYLGMKQVRIPLDGHHPIAMFTPEHVYDTIEAASQYNYPTKKPHDAVADLIIAHREIASKESVGEFIQNCINLQMIENFKAENWDAERNHLHIDKLDDFYQLWRMVMTPFGYVEAEAPVTLPSHKEAPVSAEAPRRIVSDERMEELKQKLKTALSPKPKPETPKPSKKMLRSTGVQQFNDSTQLALFDI